MKGTEQPLRAPKKEPAIDHTAGRSYPPVSLPCGHRMRPLWLEDQKAFRTGTPPALQWTVVQGEYSPIRAAKASANGQQAKNAMIVVRDCGKNGIAMRRGGRSLPLASVARPGSFYAVVGMFPQRSRHLQTIPKRDNQNRTKSHVDSWIPPHTISAIAAASRRITRGPPKRPRARVQEQETATPPTKREAIQTVSISNPAAA